MAGLTQFPTPCRRCQRVASLRPLRSARACTFPRHFVFTRRPNAYARQGDAAKVKKLLAEVPRTDVDAVDKEGQSAVHHAALRGNVDVIRVLLDNGATVKRNAKGMMPYDLATARGFASCAELLQIAAGKAGTVTGGAHAQLASDAQLSAKRRNSPGQGANTAGLSKDGAESPGLKGLGLEKQAYALYPYVAEDALPFPPDPRPEISLEEGARFTVLSVRKDGWCLVRHLNPRDDDAPREGFVPGNYLGSLAPADHGKPIFPSQDSS